VRYFDGSRRGDLRCELTKDSWRPDARTVDSIEVRESPTRTTASFVVESGRPGLVPA
jgi:alkaline phosphatase D